MVAYCFCHYCIVVLLLLLLMIFYAVTPIGARLASTGIIIIGSISGGSEKLLVSLPFLNALDQLCR